LSSNLIYALILYYKTKFNKTVLSNRSKYRTLSKYKFINTSKICRYKLSIKLIFNIDFKFVFSKKVIFTSALIKHLKFA